MNTLILNRGSFEMPADPCFAKGYAGQVGGRVNTLILNRESFKLPSDNWYQLAPLGDFPHDGAEVIQVVDETACEAMVARFNAEAGVEPFNKLRAERFAGLLIDFDHFSLDPKSRSEAAGWIVALEVRGIRDGLGVLTTESVENVEGGEARAMEWSPTAEQARCGAGLWAQIRWSDLGEEAVKGGRYRFLSPVWSRSDCEDLGDGRVRPVRLLNAAVTNDPNLKGIRPLSNSGRSSGQYAGDGGQSLANAQGDDGEQRQKWVLGASPGDRHCPSCAALAGQVHSMADWTAAGVSPGAGALFCLGNCHCSLVETDEAASGDLDAVPVRQPAPVGNRSAADWLTEAKMVLRNDRRAACGVADGCSAADVVAAAKKKLRQIG